MRNECRVGDIPPVQYIISSPRYQPKSKYITGIHLKKNGTDNRIMRTLNQIQNFLIEQQTNASPTYEMSACTLKSMRCRSSLPGYVQRPKNVSTPESVPCQSVTLYSRHDKQKRIKTMARPYK